MPRTLSAATAVSLLLCARCAHAGAYLPNAFSVSYNGGAADWSADDAELLDSVGSGPGGRVTLPGKACTTGQQSPINLVDQSAVYDGRLAELAFACTAQSTYLVELNDHTLEVKLDVTRALDLQSTGCGLDLEGFGFIPVTQIHFHSPSEHTVDGMHYPLEMHIVSQPVSLDTAQHSLVGGLPAAVVALMFAYMPDDASSPLLSTIFDSLPAAPLLFQQYVTAAAGGNQYAAGNNSVSREVVNGAPLDIGGAVAAAQPGVYFRYQGSLTTPGCSQPVQFSVLPSPLPVSVAQVTRFTNLLAGAQGGLSRGADNRPPNPALASVRVWPCAGACEICFADASFAACRQTTVAMSQPGILAAACRERAE